MTSIRYVTRILTEDGEVLVADYDAVDEERAYATHEEMTADVASGELARDGIAPLGATLTVQTFDSANDAVVAETRLEHNGEHYEETHTIGYW